MTPPESTKLRIAAIALGSNLPSTWGDRASNLREATQRLRQLGELRAISTFHDTAPVGNTDQPRFLNAALLLETALEPAVLMQALLAIERTLGRDRTQVAPKGPRTLDLDLLLMDDIVLNTPDLTLPHPELANRLFVLEPLAEIAPAMVDPISGQTIAYMAATLRAKNPAAE